MSVSAVMAWAPLSTNAVEPYSDMSAAHVLAIVDPESGGDPTRISPTGFTGLMQIGKAVVQDYHSSLGLKTPADWRAWALVPEHNLRAGAWFLEWSRRFGTGLGVSGDPWGWAMCVYGWGPGNVRTAVRQVKKDLGRAPTLDDMQEALPDAGKPNVRPWYRGKRYPGDVRTWAARLGEELPPSSPAEPSEPDAPVPSSPAKASEKPGASLLVPAVIVGGLLAVGMAAVIAGVVVYYASHNR